MWAILWCKRWIVSVNLNCQLWPKLSEVWTQETAAFYTDGPIFYPENDAIPSPLSSSKLHRQQQYTSQSEFDIRGLLETALHQWSCCWSEHKQPAGRELHNDSLLLLVTRYQIRFQFDERSTKTVILFLCSQDSPWNSNVCLSVHHFGPDWNFSRINGWIDMESWVTLLKG